MGAPSAPKIEMAPSVPSTENPYTQQKIEEQQQRQAKAAQAATGRSKTMLSSDVDLSTGERKWGSLLGG